MKKILCYGDSNTYGFIPETGGRYSKTERWTGILKSSFTNYQVLEEGMNNRTGFLKNSMGLMYSGSEYLPNLLEKYGAIDVAIIALGTNDAQIFYDLTLEIVECGLLNLIKTLKYSKKNMQIVVVPPIKITENILNSGFSCLFDKNSIEKIKTVFPIFEKVSNENNCFYFDFNEFVQPSEVDGLHFNKISHSIIAKTLIEFINNEVLN